VQWPRCQKPQPGGRPLSFRFSGCTRQARRVFLPRRRRRNPLLATLDARGGPARDCCPFRSRRAGAVPNGAGPLFALKADISARYYRTARTKAGCVLAKAVT
jgi:hypothetical protein